jgi:hypothetical protein
MFSAAIVEETHQCTAKDHGRQGSRDIWASYRADCVCVLKPGPTWAAPGDVLSSVNAEFPA